MAVTDIWIQPLQIDKQTGEKYIAILHRVVERDIGGPQI